MVDRGALSGDEGLSCIICSRMEKCLRRAHAAPFPCLREKCNAEIFTNVRFTSCCLCTHECAEILTEATEQNINKTNYNYRPACKYRQFKLCTAYYKEECKQRACPLIRLFHKVMGKRTDITEHGSEHHTYKQR